METFGHAIDENSKDAFVLSSPAGIWLCSSFRFQAVGVVETDRGKFY